MPPNFWATKAVSSPQENLELYEKHQKLADLITSPTGGAETASKQDTDECDRLMADLKDELVKGNE